MKSLQISARVWTGHGGVQRRIIETEEERIVRVLPGSAALRPEAIVYSDVMLMIPGLHDAHSHPLFGGLQLSNVNFNGIESEEEFSDRLGDFVTRREAADGEWIEGTGLDETRVRVSRRDIDQVCADVPVFIWSHDLHSAFVNSAALIRARVSGGIKDPQGGIFERDETGVLNGVLREAAAHHIRLFIPPPNAARARKALLGAQELMFSLGVTAVSGSARGDEVPHCLDFAGSAEQKLRLNLWRVSERFEIDEDRFEKRNGTRFRFATLKGFIDGALGSQTAAMCEPYANDPADTGMAATREGPLARWIRSAHREGYQIALHAIGDRANAICLDAIEMASAGGQGPEYRPRIEHAQVLRPQDIARFAELGVIASMQPIHCTADMHFATSRLGTERVKGAYAWQSLLREKVALALGSDWPVETLSPIAGIHAAVTRQDSQNRPAGGWQPQERVSVEEALTGYTGAAAYAAFWDEETGVIEEGKLADFTVLSQDLFAIPPEKILETRVEATVVGGEFVYRAPNEGKP